jgi:hypothetical protein
VEAFLFDLTALFSIIYGFDEEWPEKGWRRSLAVRPAYAEYRLTTGRR